MAATVVSVVLVIRPTEPAAMAVTAARAVPPRAAAVMAVLVPAAPVWALPETAATAGTPRRWAMVVTAEPVVLARPVRPPPAARVVPVVRAVSAVSIPVMAAMVAMAAPVELAQAPVKPAPSPEPRGCSWPLETASMV
jgi:hypothetical protein